MSKRGIFAGSFDPFTRGHQDVALRALAFLDELIIAIGSNPKKQDCFSIEVRKQIIEYVFREEPRIQVIIYNTLTVDLAKQENATLLIRGVRSISDFEYERQIADLNRQIAELETVLLFSDPAYASISSSAIRELIQYNYPVEDFLPEGLDLTQWTKK